jgi:small subunit ribosomal protein S27Ae
MAKARVGLYTTKGEVLTRTRKPCPKCGPGTFLAEHADRRSCGRCGYSESKAPEPKAAGAPERPAQKPAAKPAKAPKAAAPAAPAPPAPPAPKA